MADGVRLDIVDERLNAFDNRLTELSNLIIKVREDTNAKWNSLEKEIMDLKREIRTQTPVQFTKENKGKAPTNFNDLHEYGIRSECNSVPFNGKAYSSGDNVIRRFSSWSAPPHSSSFSTTKVRSDSMSVVSNEIAQLVQKFLPRPSEHPTWIPPSRDFMNQPLTCQICDLILDQVDNALVCDGCEKGVHLKCVKCDSDGYPRGVQWLCATCSANSNSGDPPLPKYGRVVR